MTGHIPDGGEPYSSASTYLDFAPTAKPPWRRDGLPSTQQMLEDIAEASSSGRFTEVPRNAIQCLAAVLVLEINHMELVGTQGEQDTMDIINGVTSSEPQKQQLETQNTYEALKFIHQTKEEMLVDANEETLDVLLLTTDFICSAHKRLLANLHPRAGQIRNSTTLTKTDAGLFYYINEALVDCALQCLVDQHNHIVRRSPLLRQPSASTRAIFNLAAQLQLRFLTIHPFADGNGRLSRLLVNFIVQHVLPFPVCMVPPYVSRTTYLDAIVAARDVRDGTCVAYQAPCDLAAMIIEGAWFCMRDAANLCKLAASPPRGDLFVGDEGIMRDRYAKLRDIDLNEQEQQQELALIQDAATKLREAGGGKVVVQLLKDTTCTLQLLR